MIHIVPYKISDALYDDVAKLFVEAAAHAPHTNIALPTGNTPAPLYARLINKPDINWSTIGLFMLDSYYPQKKNDPDSFYAYIQHNLLSHIALPENKFHILNSETQSPTQECENYEKQMSGAGGLDLAILGLGVNGHIAFNEPGSTKDSKTRLVELSAETIAANDPQGMKHLPKQGLSMGIDTILHAKKIVMMATGKNKAQAVIHATQGPINESCPASFLQDHPDTTFFLDKDAASLLK